MRDKNNKKFLAALSFIRMSLDSKRLISVDVPDVSDETERDFTVKSF